jgi:2-iminoacetate synthase
VACVAGIHFDGVSRGDIDSISRAAFDLAREAATRLRDQRIRDDLERAGTLRRIEQGSPSHAGLLAELFREPVETSFARFGERIRRERSDRFGDRVGLFAPLYLTSACMNDCVYCGFRRSSRFERQHLSVAEAVNEARLLHSRGLRSIDLVTGEVPTDRFVDYVAEAVEEILARTGITRVHLNLGSLQTAQYRRLRQAGAAGYHLYQETYDPDVYLEVHAAGAKRDMAARLDAPRRAVEAGFPYVGLGVLLGLADLRADLASLATHATLLRAEAPDLGIGFSLPRVQPTGADPGYLPARPVTDDDFLRSFLFLRLVDPAAHLTLTTREPPAVRDRLLQYGVTRLSAGVSTAPGGYSSEESGLEQPGREQFGIADVRSVAEIEERVREAGLSVAYD